MGFTVLLLQSYITENLSPLTEPAPQSYFSSFLSFLFPPLFITSSLFFLSQPSVIHMKAECRIRELVNLDSITLSVPMPPAAFLPSHESFIWQKNILCYSTRSV